MLFWTLLGPCLLLVGFPAYLYLWNWKLAALHLLFVTVMTGLLVETMILRLRTFPFSCSLPVFKENALVIVFLLILGFYLFVSAGSFLEYVALADPVRVILLLTLLGAWWLVLRQWRANLLDMDKQLIFEESPAATIQLLDLD